MTKLFAAVTILVLLSSPYVNAQRPSDRQVRQRADALLKQMTIEEKLGQMNQLFFFGTNPGEATLNGIRNGQIGSLLFVTDPALINRLQRIAVTESRLKIPLIFGFDVTHGFHTIFPVAIAMAASWDPKLIEKAQSVAASRSSLDLPGRQRELLEAVKATGKTVVLLLMNGRPLDISWAAEYIPSILEIWYPGSEGGNAVADLLFGDANPGGKLPVTWMKHVGQVPIYYSHNLTQNPAEQTKRYWDEKAVPLYPFGYGLSYTTFAFSNLKISQPEIKVGETIAVSVEVKNTGNRAGDEVVQLYIHQQTALLRVRSVS